MKEFCSVVFWHKPSRVILGENGTSLFIFSDGVMELVSLDFLNERFFYIYCLLDEIVQFERTRILGCLSCAMLIYLSGRARFGGSDFSANI